MGQQPSGVQFREELRARRGSPGSTRFPSRGLWARRAGRGSSSQQQAECARGHRGRRRVSGGSAGSGRRGCRFARPRACGVRRQASPRFRCARQARMAAPQPAAGPSGAVFLSLAHTEPPPAAHATAPRLSACVCHLQDQSRQTQPPDKRRDFPIAAFLQDDHDSSSGDLLGGATTSRDSEAISCWY